MEAGAGDAGAIVGNPDDGQRPARRGYCAVRLGTSRASETEYLATAAKVTESAETRPGGRPRTGSR